MYNTLYLFYAVRVCSPTVCRFRCVDLSDLLRTVDEQRENEYTTMALRYSGVRINPIRYSSSRPATNGYSVPSSNSCSSNGGGHYSANGYMNGNSHSGALAAMAQQQQQLLAYSIAQANGYQNAALYSQQSAGAQPNLNDLIYASYGEDGASQNGAGPGAGGGAQMPPQVWFPPATTASHGTPYHLQQQRQWRQLGSSPTPVLTSSGGRRGTPVSIQAPSGATVGMSSSGPRPPGSGYLNGMRLQGRESPSQSPLKFLNGPGSALPPTSYLLDPTASALG